MSTDPTCPRVSNLLLLDSEGKRIAVKYFDENKYAQRPSYPHSPPVAMRHACLYSAEPAHCRDRSSVTAQGNYEKSVFAKTSRTNARGEGALPDAACSHGNTPTLESCEQHRVHRSIVVTACSSSRRERSG